MMLIRDGRIVYIICSEHFCIGAPPKNQRILKKELCIEQVSMLQIIRNPFWTSTFLRFFMVVPKEI